LCFHISFSQRALCLSDFEVGIHAKEDDEEAKDEGPSEGVEEIYDAEQEDSW
jgi:hypothetical protein